MEMAIAHATAPHVVSSLFYHNVFYCFLMFLLGPHVSTRAQYIDM